MNHGRTFARAVKAVGVSRGQLYAAAPYAQSQGWGDVDQVVATIKAAVTAVGQGDIAPGTPGAADWADFIRPMTILGKLPGVRRVPLRVRTIAATSGSTAYWAGEEQPLPISKMALEGSSLAPLKVVAVLVSTLELMRSSSPDAESLFVRDLAAAAVAAMDAAFIDPANAGSAGVKPASITNGVTPIASSGSSLAQVDADLEDMVQALDLAGSDLSMAAWIMRPRTALYLARLRGTGGAPAYPQMTAKGGTLFGIPAITSNGVPVEVGSPGDGDTSITLLDASQIEIGDDGGGTFEVSEHGSLQMEDAPGSGAQQLVSLWQCDAAGIKTTRYVNWRRVRDGMAQVLTAVGY